MEMTNVHPSTKSIGLSVNRSTKIFITVYYVRDIRIAISSLTAIRPQELLAKWVFIYLSVYVVLVNMPRTRCQNTRRLLACDSSQQKLVADKVTSNL